MNFIFQVLDWTNLQDTRKPFLAPPAHRLAQQIVRNTSGAPFWKRKTSKENPALCCHLWSLWQTKQPLLYLLFDDVVDIKIKLYSGNLEYLYSNSTILFWLIQGCELFSWIDTVKLEKKLLSIVNQIRYVSLILFKLCFIVDCCVCSGKLKKEFLVLLWVVWWTVTIHI